MSTNEEHRQRAVAAEVEEAARTLAHSTRTVPFPADSYELLGELRSTVDHLEQVCRQLATWHETTANRAQIDGNSGGATAHERAHGAAADLTSAARALDEASTLISRAHTSNAVLHWPSLQEPT